MKTSDYIAQAIADRGVTHVFEMIGGMTTHLIDSIAAAGRISIISVHHEQAAAFAVDGHARMRGHPAVALATSGPGATNLLTGIGSCFFDSVPAVFITGQVNRHERKGIRKVRQLGFQETDIVAMAAPITKAAWQLDDPTTLPTQIAEAFELAMDGRPGPVLLDIPMDIQRIEIAQPTVSLTLPKADRSHVCVGESWDLIRQSKRPLILVGGGVSSSGSRNELLKCLENAHIPVVYSLMGVDLLPHGHPCRVGLIGSYGNRWANLAIDVADIILVLGSRLDIRQTGSDPASFKGSKIIIHVDCDPGEVNNRVVGCVRVIAHLKEFLTVSAAHLEASPIKAGASWFEAINHLQNSHPDTAEAHVLVGPCPNDLIKKIARMSGRAAAVCVDVGQHQMWAAQSWEPSKGQRFLTSGGMGSMGFALPAAIGAACASSGIPVLVVAGDGGFQCNIQELETIRRLALPIKIVIFNNRCHGMVRQFQESYFNGRYQSTLHGYSTPDFAAVANAYGIPGKRLETAGAINEGLSWLWEISGPALLEVPIDSATNVYPKLAFGRPFPAMEPDVLPSEMEGT